MQYYLYYCQTENAFKNGRYEYKFSGLRCIEIFNMYVESKFDFYLNTPDQRTMGLKLRILHSDGETEFIEFIVQSIALTYIFVFAFISREICRLAIGFELVRNNLFSQRNLRKPVTFLKLSRSTKTLATIRVCQHKGQDSNRNLCRNIRVTVRLYVKRIYVFLHILQLVCILTTSRSH